MRESCLVAARALYGDRLGAEAFVLHHFGGIGSRQWEWAVEAVRREAEGAIADLMAFSDEYVPEREPVQVKKEYICLD